MDVKSKRTFFLTNFIKGLVWIFVIILIFIVFKRYIRLDYFSWFEPILDNQLLMFFIYTISELFIGIIPPELFFIWASLTGKLDLYIQYSILLAVISYLAGLLDYWFGRKLNYSVIFRWLKKKYLIKYDKYLNHYGFFLIIVAAMTPIPFSGTCMLMGSVNYSFRKIALYAMTRFVRYFIYSIVFWEITLL